MADAEDADDVGLTRGGDAGAACGWGVQEKKEIAHVTVSATTVVTIIARAMPTFREGLRPAFRKRAWRSSNDGAPRAPNLVLRWPAAPWETCSLSAAANWRHRSNRAAGSFARPLKNTSSRSARSGR